VSGGAPVVLVGRDGRERTVTLSAGRQAAAWARLLHAGQGGVVEVAGAVRLADGRLRFAGGRREAADYPRAGELGAFVERVRLHARAGREVFAAPLARERPEPTNEAVAGGRVLWVDLDRVDERAGLRRLGPLRPHLIVASGGGLHAYWLCEGELSSDDLESANRRLAARLQGDIAVANRGRVLRVPGTLNRKRDRPCRILRIDLARPRVAYVRLAASLGDPRPARNGYRRNGAAPVRRPIFDPVDELTPRQYFALLCGVEPDHAGYLLCPLPDHHEDTPSCRLYEDHWWCYGCGRGGGIYDLASLLLGGPWGTALRGPAFAEAVRNTRERRVG
jgi:hypothetical protein